MMGNKACKRQITPFVKQFPDENACGNGYIKMYINCQGEKFLDQHSLQDDSNWVTHYFINSLPIQWSM